MPWDVGPRSVAYTWCSDGGVNFALQADSIRHTNSGLHARISVLQDGRILSDDTFNVQKDRDRTHLTNAAWEKLAKDDRPSKVIFAYYLADFCRDFWNQWVDQYGVEDALPESGPFAQPLVLNPYIVQGGGTILFGAPGAGKSYLALMMAQSVNLGLEHYWQVVRRPVLFVNLERGQQGIERRITFVNQQLGLSPAEELPRLNARGKALPEVIGIIERAVEQRKIGLVVLDSISRGGSGSLVEDETANRIMDALNGCCESWLAIGHSPRGDAEHVYGSQMFDAAADVTIQASSQRKTDGTVGIGLQVKKANDIAFPPMQVWALEFDQYGLSAFRPARKGEFAEIEAGEASSMEDQVRAYLLRTGEDDATSISEELHFSRQKVSSLLARSEQFCATRRDGKRQLYAVKADPGWARSGDRFEGDT